MIQARDLVPGIGDYSTSEQDTGFTWIDEKPIYKKTINFGKLPNNTSKSVAHGITNLKEIIKTYGTATHTDGIVLPIPFVGVSALSAGVSLNFSSTEVVITAGNDRSSLRKHI